MEDARRPPSPPEPKATPPEAERRHPLNEVTPPERSGTPYDPDSPKPANRVCQRWAATAAASRMT